MQLNIMKSGTVRRGGVRRHGDHVVCDSIHS
jgi:hypothetical protein